MKVHWELLQNKTKKGYIVSKTKSQQVGLVIMVLETFPAEKKKTHLSGGNFEFITESI